MNFNRLYSSVLIFYILSIFSISSFALNSEKDQNFVQYLPANSSPEYVIKAIQLYKKLQNEPKEGIKHNRLRGILGSYTVYTDFGSNFPSIYQIQKELLEFCSQCVQKEMFIDVGAGCGYDTIAMILTGKAHVTAFEIEKPQYEILKNRVISLLSEINKNSLEKNVEFRHADFLKVEYSKDFEGQFSGINANKIIHFLDPEQTETFFHKAAFLLKPGGRLFITTAMPTPGDQFEEFIKKNQNDKFPGFVFYKRKDRLNENGDKIVGEPVLMSVRQPTSHEQGGYFFQTIEKDDKNTFVVTDRVIHYHTEQTLTHILNDKFKIIKVIKLLPKDIHPDAFESVISIVAERKA